MGLGLPDADILYTGRKLCIGKAYLKERSLPGGKEIDGSQELADITVLQSGLMIDCGLGVILTKQLMIRIRMMMHACKQQCLQEEYQQQR